MKKFRIVGLLLVLCLITSSFVGVTFAKYTSTGSGTDTAIVAKWSVKVEGTQIAVQPEITNLAINLFDTITDDDKANIDAGTNDANVDDGTKNPIIAPGTGGKFELKLANESEVTAEYTVTWTVEENDDIPIQYSVDGNTWSDNISSLNITTTTIPMKTGAASQTVYWRWAFDEDVENHHASQNDEADTALGIAAQTAAPSITVMATIVFTQVD